MTNEKPRRNRSPANATSRLNTAQLARMNWLFPGFAREYETTHDATGKPLPNASMQGLRYIGEQHP